MTSPIRTYSRNFRAHAVDCKGNGFGPNVQAVIPDACADDQARYDGAEITVLVNGKERQAVLRGDLYNLGENGTGDPVVQLLD